MNLFKNKANKKYKIIGITFFSLLLFWFTLNLTGLKINGFYLVKSCFIDESIDFLFWSMYVACFIVFLLKDEIGKYILTGYSLLWGIIQLSNYFRNASGIKSYNETFRETHRIFRMSDLFIVKDTYHLFLDIFIFIVICYGIFYIIMTTFKKNKNKSTNKSEM